MSINLPSDIIIVVGRQFGSGGRALGRMLAEKYSLRYFDKEVLAEAARKFGYSQDIFARYDEKRPSPLRSMLTNAFGLGDTYIQNPMSGEAIYEAQSRVIRELAGSGGCVFVGRSADYILRDHPNLVSIFLSSPIEKRAEILINRGDADSTDKALEMARKFDRKREDFYNYFTGRHWGRAENYHLSLDTTRLGRQAAFNVIASYISERFAPRQV